MTLEGSHVHTFRKIILGVGGVVAHCGIFHYFGVTVIVLKMLIT